MTGLAAAWGRKSLNARQRPQADIFKPHEEKAKKAREKERGERFLIELCGRPVPATNTEEGTVMLRVWEAGYE